MYGLFWKKDEVWPKTNIIITPFKKCFWGDLAQQPHHLCYPIGTKSFSKLVSISDLESGCPVSYPIVHVKEERLFYSTLTIEENVILFSQFIYCYVKYLQDAYVIKISGASIGTNHQNHAKKKHNHSLVQSIQQGHLKKPLWSTK